MLYECEVLLLEAVMYFNIFKTYDWIAGSDIYSPYSSVRPYSRNSCWVSGWFTL